MKRRKRRYKQVHEKIGRVPIAGMFKAGTHFYSFPALRQLYLDREPVRQTQNEIAVTVHSILVKRRGL